jgi:hypothetical protein
MTEKVNEIDVMYYQLVLSLQASAMQHMGKVMSPVSGKIERNLDAARYSIDMLDMLQRKTQGNLSTEEEKLLEHVLYELRLNFVDESGKGQPEDETAESPDSAPEPAPEAGDEPAEKPPQSES